MSIVTSVHKNCSFYFYNNDISCRQFLRKASDDVETSTLISKKVRNSRPSTFYNALPCCNSNNSIKMSQLKALVQLVNYFSCSLAWREDIRQTPCSFEHY